VLAGGDDPIVPLINGRILARCLPRARLHVIVGGGHLFLLEQPRGDSPAGRHISAQRTSEEQASIIRPYII
jgi:pimeloyl-ACP methyl ester carboxylesterase